MALLKRFLSRLKILPLYILPHHLLCRLMQAVTHCRLRPWKNLLIRCFIRQYRIDLDSVLEPDLSLYPSFNHFFTRALKPEARPIDTTTGTLCSPVDGTLSQAGIIRGESLIQAKGHEYSLTELLAGDEPLAQRFTGGSFATIYLSPRDYHRIHMPIDGCLRGMVYIPGRLFAVNQSAVAHIDNLFTRNERVINLFETALGEMALIMVGALLVGGMETVWSGPVTPPPRSGVMQHSYPQPGQPQFRLGKGEEMGRFNMGSTVILLFPPDRVEWRTGIQPGDRLKMGQTLARLKAGRSENTG